MSSSRREDGFKLQVEYVQEEPEIYSNEYKPKKKRDFELVEVLQPLSSPQFSVLKNPWPEHKNSIFLNIEKIEKDSIYNTVF